MTNKQRIFLMTLWQKAAKAQGWKASDSARRHALYAEVLGVEKRFNEFTQGDFDQVKAALKALADNLQGAVEVDHPELGEARRWLWVIENEHIPALRSYGKDPESYITSLIKDKFRAVKGIGTWRDLIAQRTHPDRPSQLEQLLITLAARIDTLRREAGESKAEMRARLETFKESHAAEFLSPDAEPDEELACVGVDQPF